MVVTSPVVKEGNLVMLLQPQRSPYIRPSQIAFGPVLSLV